MLWFWALSICNRYNLLLSIYSIESAKAYACGLNDQGQVGAPESQKEVRELIPVQIPDNKPIIKVSAKGWSSLFLASDGSVYYCGSVSCDFFTTNNNRIFWMMKKTLFILQYAYRVHITTKK
jgi:alpha-tubulin suppressor-like RCC1 family protein